MIPLWIAAGVGLFLGGSVLAWIYLLDSLYVRHRDRGLRAEADRRCAQRSKAEGDR